MSQWAHLYNTRRWRARRQLQLRDHPLCAMCLDKGMVTAATVVHHVVPHRGDRVLFETGILQSLCKEHHDIDAQIIDGKGYSDEIGEDGWPTHKNHPINK